MMKHIYRGCGRTCNRLAGQARLALSAQQHSAPQSNRFFTHTSLTQNQASQEGSTADKYGSKLKEWWAKTTAKHVKADVDANVDVNNTEEVYGKMTPEVQDKVLNEFKEAKEDGGALSQILGGKKDPYYVPAPTYNIDGLLTVHGEELKRCNLNGIKTNGKTKRFYREVDVVQMNNGMWCPLLGGRAIQTRVGKLMMVPTQSLALAIAFEWDSQLEFIKPSSMPIMTLATTSMDQMVAVRPKIMHEIEGWIEADSTFNMMEGANSADGMSKLKRKYYRPLLEWMKKEYGIEINYSYSIRAAKQSEETKATIKNLYKDCNDWELTALDSFLTITKSCVISWALFKGKMNLDTAYNTTRLEENYQQRKYGVVEGVFGHEVDIEYIKMKLAATQTYLNLISEASPESIEVSAPLIQSRLHVANDPMLGHIKQKEF